MTREEADQYVRDLCEKAGVPPPRIVHTPVRMPVAAAVIPGGVMLVSKGLPEHSWADMVLAHEVGHYVRRHVERMTLMPALVGAMSLSVQSYGVPDVVRLALSLASFAAVLYATFVLRRRYEAEASVVGGRLAGDLDSMLEMESHRPARVRRMRAFIAAEV